MTDTPYDLVAYPNHAHAQTHPERLAVLGRLFGLSPADVTRCRVLELGCGAGGNIVPLAACFPDSDFVGVDLAAKPIQQAEQMASDLGLKNIRILLRDFADLDVSLGTFDFIIAHGLYSWIPQPARKKLLDICKQRLSRQGIAFVSYNALPGGHLARITRDLMLFHTREISEPECRMNQALAVVRFVARAQKAPCEYQAFMSATLEEILGHDEGHLFHDELGGVNDPCYFLDFIGNAASVGLQFLAEADFFDMSDGAFSEEAQEELRSLAGNRLIREQYLDFLKCRRFRQTLLCHDSNRLSAQADTGCIKNFWISSTPLQKSRSDGGKEHSGLGTLSGSRIHTDFDLGKVALGHLETTWPARTHFQDLYTLARTIVSARNVVPEESPELFETLSDFLLKLYSAGAVQFHTSDQRCVVVPGERPMATLIARWQAERGSCVTTAGHLTIKLEDDMGRKLVALMDGTRDLDQIAEELLPVLLGPSPGEEQIEKARLELAQRLKPNIESLGRLGLLSG